MTYLPVSYVQRRKSTLLDQLTDECFSFAASNTVTNSNIVTAEKEKSSKIPLNFNGSLLHLCFNNYTRNKPKGDALR